MTIYGGETANVNPNLGLQDFGYGRMDVLGATAGSVWDEGIGGVIDAAKLLKLSSGDDRITQAQALERLGSEGLSIDIPQDGTTETALELLIERERERILRDGIMALRDDDPGAGALAQQIGVGLATSVVDPLNVLSAVIPAYGLYRVARTSEKVARVVKQRPVATAVGEAVVGAGIAEAVVYPTQQYLGGDYDAYDSLVNVGFGAFTAGGIQRLVGTSAKVRESLERNIAEAVKRASADPQGRSVADILDEILMEPTAPRTETGPAGEAPPTPEAQRQAQIIDEIEEKVQYASAETKEAVFRALMMNAIEGKQIDIQAILDADIDALAGRQVFALNELEDVMQNNFKEVLEYMNSVLNEQVLGKRRYTRSKKQIKELQKKLDDLFTPAVWAEYKELAGQTIKTRFAAQRLAQSLQRKDEADAKRMIEELRQRIEAGRAAEPVKRALDRLQQKVSEHEAVKQLVIRNAEELQAKIDQHPESVKKLKQVRQQAVDPKASVLRDDARDEQVEEILKKPEPPPDDDEAYISELDSLNENMAINLRDMYGDDAESVLRDVQLIEQQAAQNAEAIKNAARCISV